MTDEHIEKTKSAIESAENIPADRKAELLDLLSKLKPAIAKVSETHHEDAKSIARLVEASAHETIRAEKKPEHTNRLLRELKQSAERDLTFGAVTLLVNGSSSAPRRRGFFETADRFEAGPIPSVFANRKG